MKKISEENSDLLGRKIVSYEIDYLKGGVPKKEAILEEVAKNSNVDKELIKVKHIYPYFGVEKAKVIAYIYKTKEALKRFEELKKKKKKREKTEVKEDGKEEVKQEEKKK